MDENSQKNQEVIQKRDDKITSFTERLEKITLINTYKNSLGIY